MTTSHDNNVALTYLALRLAMILLVGLLFASVTFQIIASGCLQRSISAYYYTAARPVFVAALCAVGACLIVYRGNTDAENGVLDVCGFLAFIVAFVPTTVDDTCTASNIPTAAELDASTQNNVWVLLLAGLAASAVGVYLMVKASDVDNFSLVAKVSMGLSIVGLLGGAYCLAVYSEEFVTRGHKYSAIAFFVGIVAVVMLNARDYGRQASNSRRLSKNWYGIIALVMVASSIAALLAYARIPDFKHVVFCIEAVLIFEFAVFWAIQTHELRGSVARARPESVEPVSSLDLSPTSAAI